MEETKLWSKSLIKANQVILKENDPLVVDSNELIAKKIEQVFPGLLASTLPTDGFRSGLNAPQVQLDEDGEVPGEVEELLGFEISQQPIFTGPSPEELIAEAKAEIEEIRKEAEKGISFLKKRSMEEGRKQGYEEGKHQAMQELEIQKQALKEKEILLEQQFQSKVDQLEPLFIETLTGIYEQIFQLELASYKPILMHAISTTIRHIEGSRDFLVHVSRKDYQEVADNKKQLLESIGSQTVTLEIIEDITLKENQCMIETSTGIYDCGIGTQLEELTKRLRLLSYET